MPDLTVILARHGGPRRCRALPDLDAQTAQELAGFADVFRAIWSSDSLCEPLT